MYAAGIDTFAGAAGFAPGGVSGLALILNHLWGLPVGIMTLVLNVPLVLISYKAVGKKFLLKTAVTMLISTFFLDIVFPFFPLYRGQRLLAAVYSGVLLGGGMVLFYLRGSVLWRNRFSDYGNKKEASVVFAWENHLDDRSCSHSSWLAGIRDVDAVLYGLIATFASVVVIDKVLYGIGAGTLAIIITSDGKKMAKVIRENADRGVTLIEAIGGYTGQQKSVLLCACSKSEAYTVQEAVRKTDETAFLMFTETSEVFGEGFKHP